MITKDAIIRERWKSDRFYESIKRNFQGTKGKTSSFERYNRTQNRSWKFKTVTVFVDIRTGKITSKTKSREFEWIVRAFADDERKNGQKNPRTYHGAIKTRRSPRQHRGNAEKSDDNQRRKRKSHIYLKINADVLVQMLTLIIVKFTLSCRCRSSVIFGGKQATDRVVFIFSLPAFFSPRKATSNIQVVSESRLENNKTSAIFLFFYSSFFLRRFYRSAKLLIVFQLGLNLRSKENF